MVPAVSHGMRAGAHAAQHPRDRLARPLLAPQPRRAAPKPRPAVRRSAKRHPALLHQRGRARGGTRARGGDARARLRPHLRGCRRDHADRASVTLRAPQNCRRQHDLCRRVGRCLRLHAKIGASLCGAWSPFRAKHDHPGPRSKPRRHRRGTGQDRGWRLCIDPRRCLCGLSGQLQPGRAQATRYQSSDLPGEGLFRHLAGARSRTRLQRQPDRRRAQARLLAPGRAAARGWHGGAQRLRSGAQPGAVRGPGAAPDRAVSRRLRAGPGRLLDRPAARDAVQRPLYRADPIPEPVLEHRARDAGMDAFLRLRPRAGRHRERRPAGDRLRI
jgi:hypothetical protein